VIAGCGNPRCLKQAQRFAHARNRWRINDNAAARNPSDGVQQQTILRFAVALLHQVAKIWPPKAGDVLERVTQAQLLNNIVTNALRGAGGERRNRLSWKLGAETAQLTILRPEIVAPFRNAMRFVNDEERELQLLEPPKHPLLHDRFRRKVKQAVTAFDGATLHFFTLLLR